MQIAIDSYCYHRYFGEVYPNLEDEPGSRMTLQDFIDRAVAHGVRGVSMESFMLTDASPAALACLRERLDCAGLERVWAWGHPDGLGSGHNPGALSDLLHHIEIAASLGASVMRVCAGGRRTRTTDWPSQRDALVPLLSNAARFAASYGINLAVENHVDLLVDEMLELLDAVDHPALGVCLDTANNLRMLEDPMRAIELLAPHARATHIKDITAYRGDPRTFGFWPSVPLGDGLIDIPRTLQLLRKHDFRGLLALEIDYLHPAYGNEEQAITKSLAYLRNLLEAY